MSKYELKQEGSTLYALNVDGTNAFSMQVQEGFNDAGERLTPEQCEAIAVGIMYGLGCYNPTGSRVDFSPIIDNQ